MRPNPVKRLLKAGKPAVGTWLSLGSPLAARFMARSGWDWLTVDTSLDIAGSQAVTGPDPDNSGTGAAGLTSSVCSGARPSVRRCSADLRSP